MEIRAYAKINLGLDVIRKREDGYHEVKMVMQTIDIYDTLFIERCKKEGIHLRTDALYIPCDEENLVYKAAALMKREYGLSGGIAIDLKKVIPAAAGMAGGSADAAATLLAVNEIFGLGLTKKQLMKEGVKLGADVPYCLFQGTALAEGIGEILSPLAPMPKAYIIGVKPPLDVATAAVYGALDVKAIQRHPDIDALADSLQSGDIRQIIPHMGNVLEEVTQKFHPMIGGIKERLTDLGALIAMMSGSGPTVFAIFDEEEKAEKAEEILRKEQGEMQVFLTVPFNP